MPLLIAIILAAAAVFATTALHYEAIHRLDLYARARGTYPTLYMVIAVLILLHMSEIGLYAVLFALADGPLRLGDFRGAGVMGPMDDIYFAAEAYASLGYGDVTPTGEMRLIASVAPLNGILLLAWSGSFLFALVQHWRGRGRLRLARAASAGPDRRKPERSGAMIRFDGQVAIVTGAGKGIGRAYAETLAARGAKVVVNNRRHPGEATSSADDVVAAIRAAGGEAVANYDAVDLDGAGERIVAQALTDFGGLHILMCNAGVGPRGMMHKQDEALVRSTVDINVFGSVEPVRAAMPHLRAQKYGRILLTTSGAGIGGSVGFAVYAATKSAMHGFAASASLEADRAGVLINVIGPSALTNMTRWALEPLGKDEATRAQEIPVQPVAEVAAYMVSREFDGRAEIWNVSGGQVHVTRLIDSRGIDIPPSELTAERAAELAPRIRDLKDAKLVELQLG